MNCIEKFVAVFFLLLMVFPACGADLDKERAAILEVDKQWASAVAEGRDIDHIVSFWADDATVFPPGVPAVVGKDAIRRFVQESLANGIQHSLGNQHGYDLSGWYFGLCNR